MILVYILGIKREFHTLGILPIISDLTLEMEFIKH